MVLLTQHPMEQAGTPRKPHQELSSLGTAMERKQKGTKAQQQKGAHTEMPPWAIVDLRPPWDAVVERLVPTLPGSIVILHSPQASMAEACLFLCLVILV